MYRTVGVMYHAKTAVLHCTVPYSETLMDDNQPSSTSKFFVATLIIVLCGSSKSTYLPTYLQGTDSARVWMNYFYFYFYFFNRKIHGSAIVRIYTRTGIDQQTKLPRRERKKERKKERKRHGLVETRSEPVSLVPAI